MQGLTALPYAGFGLLPTTNYTRSNQTTMHLDLDGQGPKYRQLHRAIRDAVLGGRLVPGTRLPPSREWARELGVSRQVVVTALECLQAEGVISARQGSGSFVANGVQASAPALPPVAVTGLSARAQAATLEWQRYTPAAREQPGVVDFRYGQVVADAPLRNDWGAALSRAARGCAAGYGPAAGEPALRAALATHLNRFRGLHCHAEQIVITAGSQQGLTLLAQALLAPGQAALVENPGYRGARQAVSFAGGRVVPMPVDDDGLIVDALPRPCDAGLLYVTPAHQFPTGGVLPLARRQAVLDWAAQTGTVVIEDDYDGEFRYAGDPLPALAGLPSSAVVVYCGTFSKLLAPALRLGYLVLPPAWVTAVTALRWLIDRHSPTVEQLALADLMTRGRVEWHLRRLRRRHLQRRDAVLEGMHAAFGPSASVHGAHTGLHLTVDLPAGTDLQNLIERAASRGVRLYSTANLYHGPSDDAPRLLLGYAHLNPGQIRDGLQRLAGLAR